MIEKYALFRLIGALMEAPEPMSIRALAEKARLSSSAAKGWLDWLHGKQIVRKKVIGRNFLFSLNLENPVTRHIKKLHSLVALQESGLVEEIKKRFPSVTSIVLYGSVARGEDDPGSDIDVLVISRKSIKMAQLRAARKLGRELTLLAYTLSEWRKKAKDDPVFYESVIIDGIALYGELPVVK